MQESSCSSSPIKSSHRMSLNDLMLNNVMNMKKYKSLKYQGWLEKKSPALLKGWQKRYFMIIDNNGYKLVYFKDEKLFSKPKGAFDLKNYIEIEQLGKKEFIIKFPSRNLQLRSDSEIDKIKWIKIIEEYNINNKKCLSLDSIILQNEEIQNRKISNHKKVSVQITQVVQIEKEKLESIKQPSRNDIKMKSIQPIKIFNNEQMLQSIGMDQKIIQQYYNCRIIYGQLKKRSKRSQIKQFQYKWFFLISSKPLFPNIEDDQSILMQEQINLELDTLIQINMNKNGTIQQKIYAKMIDCQEIIIKNMQQSKDKGFTFKLNLGDKILSLKTDSENDRLKWTNALNESIMTINEIYNNQNIILKKNINALILKYDQEISLIERRKKIKQIILNNIIDIELQLHMNEYNRYNQLIDFINLLTLISDDLLQIIEACLVKNPQRVDIIKEYLDIEHETICDYIINYWNKNYEIIQLNELIQLTQWINNYDNKIKQFIQDQRLQQGKKQLIKIFIFRWQLQTEQIIQQFSSEPLINQQQYQTIISQELLQMIQLLKQLQNESFNYIISEIQLKKSIKQIFLLYLEIIEELLQEENIKQEFIIGIINDYNIIQQMCQIIDETIFIIIQKSSDFGQKLLKKYEEIIIEEAIQLILNQNINKFQNEFQNDILNIDLNNILIIFQENQLYTKIIEQYYVQIKIKLIYQINVQYFNQFINEIQDLNIYKKKQLEAKLNSNQVIIKQFLQDNQIIHIEIYKIMIQLLFIKYEDLIPLFKDIKQYYGQSFTKYSCLILLQNLNCHQSIKNKSQQLSIEQLNEEIYKAIDIEHGESTQDLSPFQDLPILQKQNSNTSRSSIQSNTDKNKVNIEELISKSQYLQYDEGIYEGYLYKRKIKTQKQLIEKWDYRYIRIRNSCIYWYKDEKSQKSQNKIQIEDIDKIIENKDKLTEFTIILKNGRNYEFKSITCDEKRDWLISIRNQQQEKNKSNKIETIIPDNIITTLIINYDEEKMKQLDNKIILQQEQFQQRKPTYIKQQDHPLELGQTSIIKKQNKKTPTCFIALLICLGIKQ